MDILKRAINFGESMEKLAQGYVLEECPIWVPRRGLLYSDVLSGGVFCADRQGNVMTVFAYRKGIGGMSVHGNGGMIVSERNISRKSVTEGDTITVLDQNIASGLISFNDITTNDVGRIYAASYGATPVFEDGRELRSGDLYLIELKK